MTVQEQKHDLDRARLNHLLDDERLRLLEKRPRSVTLFTQAEERFVGGVPLGWMRWWLTPIPLVSREASGSHLIDGDGHEYIDFGLWEVLCGPPPARPLRNAGDMT